MTTYKRCILRVWRVKQIQNLSGSRARLHGFISFFNLQVVCLHHQVALLSRKPACYYPSEGWRGCDSLPDESTHCGGKLIRPVSSISLPCRILTSVSYLLYRNQNLHWAYSLGALTRSTSWILQLWWKWILPRFCSLSPPELSFIWMCNCLPTFHSDSSLFFLFYPRSLLVHSVYLC